MARANLVVLTGIVASEEMDSRMIDASKTDGTTDIPVLNFLVKCFDQVDKRFYTLPVAAWGTDLVSDCMNYMKKGDLVYIEGELRYKHIKNPITRETEKIYTTVKARTVEFISKKLKDEALELQSHDNTVRLIGNLVHDPNDDAEGFVLAVDRLYPPKDMKISNDKLTDYVTLVVRDKELFNTNLKKGSAVIVSGKLLTKKRDENAAKPRVVVDVCKIVGR
jgi:single-stranded DNA-binding protein